VCLLEKLFKIVELEPKEKKNNIEK